jgi:hypothetical protein
VVFTSSASNLVARDNNNAPDVFIRDLQSSTTALVSVNAATNGSGSGASFLPSISVDGRYVLFHSLATNLVSNSLASAVENLYWRDMQAGTTRALTALSASGSHTVGAMTPDGQYVAYAGFAGSSTSATVYLWSAQSGKNTYTNTQATAGAVVISPSGTRIAYYGANYLALAVDVSANSTTSLGNLPFSGPAGLQFSADSQFLANVVDQMNLGWPSNQVYLYSFQTLSNTLISRVYNSSAGGNDDSDSPAISADDRFVVYRSFASNLVPGDTNGVPDIFIYDTVSGSNMLLTVDQFGNGPANNRSLNLVFSGAGQTLVFASCASDLASGDGNEWSDIFAFQPYSAGATNANGSFVINGPTFTSVSWQNLSDLAPTLTWLTMPGASYQVQFKDDLNDPIWENLTNNVSIVGGQGYALDLASTNVQRFYRVVASP